MKNIYPSPSGPKYSVLAPVKGALQREHFDRVRSHISTVAIFSSSVMIASPLLCRLNEGANIFYAPAGRSGSEFDGLRVASCTASQPPRATTYRNYGGDVRFGIAENVSNAKVTCFGELLHFVSPPCPAKFLMNQA
jgi:hypothetical protein